MLLSQFIYIFCNIVPIKKINNTCRLKDVNNSLQNNANGLFSSLDLVTMKSNRKFLVFYTVLCSDYYKSFICAHHSFFMHLH